MAMKTTCFLLLVSCLFGAGTATPGNQSAHAIPVSILAVDVMQDGASVAAEPKTVTMFMYSKAITTVRIAVTCENEGDDICIAITPNDITGQSVLFVDTRKVCFKCTHLSSENATHDNSSTVNETIKELNETVKGNARKIETLVNITVESGLIGVAELNFKLVNNDTNISNTGYIPDSAKLEFRVVRAPSPLDLVFVVCVYCLEIIEMLVFGTQIEVKTLKKTFRRPLYPLIGFVCQYVGMPLIAYSIAKAVPGDRPLSSLGIFVAGICPGGGASNIYSYLLDGDLSLSITMTTISTVMSLGMMPLWLYTLGQEFLDSDTAAIPYTDILVTLSIILLPLYLGHLIQSKQPRAATLVQKVLTWVITVIALVLIVTGVYANLYIFKLMTLEIVAIGIALPYVGFFLGGTVALLVGLPAEVVKTIAIETGMQNTGVGFLLLYNSLSEPYGDLASIAPVSAEVMSPIPPLIIAIVYLIHKKFCRKYTSVPQKTTATAPPSEQTESVTDVPCDDGESVDKDLKCIPVDHSNGLNELMMQSDPKHVYENDRRLHLVWSWLLSDLDEGRANMPVPSYLV